MFERRLSARTIEYTNAVLQSAFRQAVRWSVLAEDPCVGVDLPRMKRREMEALSAEECRRFLAVARETEWFALYALALTTERGPANTWLSSGATSIGTAARQVFVEPFSIPTQAFSSTIRSESAVAGS